MLKKLILRLIPGLTSNFFIKNFMTYITDILNQDNRQLNINGYTLVDFLTNVLLLLICYYVYIIILNNIVFVLPTQLVITVAFIIYISDDDTLNDAPKSTVDHYRLGRQCKVVLVQYLSLTLWLILTEYIYQNPSTFNYLSIFMQNIDDFSYIIFTKFEKILNLDTNDTWSLIKHYLTEFNYAFYESFTLLQVVACEGNELDGHCTANPAKDILNLYYLNVAIINESLANVYEELLDWIEITHLFLRAYINFHIGFAPTKPQYMHNLYGAKLEYSALVQECVNEANQRKVLHIMPLNLNVNRYTGVNTHFPSYRQSTLLNLTVWQYWWWMSFIAVMVLFNRVLLKIFLSNTLRIEPKVHTSIKSNGRWGDLVASLFPVFWCSNILVNSNFILRIIENHSESGVFVVRIRGKQWYWVYKFSVNLKNDLNDMSIIIGRGNKINVTYGVHSSVPSNNVIPSTRWVQKINNSILANKRLNARTLNLTTYTTKTPASLNMFEVPELTNTRTGITKWGSVNFTDQMVTKKPVKHDKYYLQNSKRKLVLSKTYRCHGNKLFVLRHQTNHNYRPYNRFFYSIQQQPKSVWKGIKKNNVIYFNSETSFDLTNRQQHQVKKIKPLSSTQRRRFLTNLRMISTYNTLILPTKVNITVITNSFDVVHSWFVPGLGLKFDCVPGRSTHYTLRIDKPGLYYGHCAEVCGRFHHHMPIKICALPLNQFLYYYNTYYKI